jgi:hypothetical protein
MNKLRYAISCFAPRLRGARKNGRLVGLLVSRPLRTYRSGWQDWRYVRFPFAGA